MATVGTVVATVGTVVATVGTVVGDRGHRHRRPVRTGSRKHIRYEEARHGEAGEHDYRPVLHTIHLPVSKDCCTQQELLHLRSVW